MKVLESIIYNLLLWGTITAAVAMGLLLAGVLLEGILTHYFGPIKPRQEQPRLLLPAPAPAADVEASPETVEEILIEGAEVIA